MNISFGCNVQNIFSSFRGSYAFIKGILFSIFSRIPAIILFPGPDYSIKQNIPSQIPGDRILFNYKPAYIYCTKFKPSEF
ncbi:MAG: hypothetical protein WB996_07435 [Ignavibacteriaceae bacterium]